MKFIPVLTASIFGFLLACSPSKKSNKVNNEAKSFNHLFIIGNTADIMVRVQLEKEITAFMNTNGYKVVKSIDIFPPSLNDPRPPTREQIADSIMNSGCDALFVVSLKKNEEINYNPGTKVNGTTPWISGLVSSSLGYSNGNVSDTKSVDKPGAFAYNSGFYISCDLLDANTKASLHSGISGMIDYSKLSTVGMNYISGVIKQLESKKILKK